MTTLLSLTTAPGDAPPARLVRPYLGGVRPPSAPALPLSAPELPPPAEPEAVDPAVRRRVAAAVLALLELLGGQRSLTEADRLVEEHVHDALLALQAECIDRRIGLRALLVQSPAADVVEACAVASFDGRIRGLALRFRWAADALVCAALAATPRVSCRRPDARGTA